jgi:hypothetical protein
MALVAWIGNGQATQQVEQATVTAVTPGGTLTATLNGKSITYTCVVGDTTTTAAAAWVTLLSNQGTAPPEFNEESWSSAANVVTATANVAGTPFAGVPGGLVFSAAAGAALTPAHVTPNSSPADVANPANWLRLGANSLPQAGDDAVIANTSVPLLWGLGALSTVRLNSWTRWQSFSGTVGLPEVNPGGYYEYRQTYLQLASNVTTFPLLLGQGSGSGPSRERYDCQGFRTTLNALAGGSPADSYSIRFLGQNPFNVVQAVGTSVGVAMLPAEVAALASATCDGGGLLDLGPGVAFSGILTYIGGSVGTVQIGGVSGTSSSPAAAGSGAPSALNLQTGSAVRVTGTGQTWPSVTVNDGSTLVWQADGTVGVLTMARGGTFDKSGDVRPMGIGQAAIDTTSTILDPNNAVTFLQSIQVAGPIQAGPVQVGPGRRLQVF